MSSSYTIVEKVDDVYTQVERLRSLIAEKDINLSNKIESLEDKILKLRIPQDKTSQIMEELRIIKSEILHIDLKGLEESINVIAENLPDLKPLLERIEISFQVMKIIGQNVGVDPNVIDRLVPPTQVRGSRINNR